MPKALDLRYMSGTLFKEKIMSKKDKLVTDIDPVSNKYGVDINIPDVVRAQLKAYSRGQITAENAAWEIQQLNIRRISKSECFRSDSLAAQCGVRHP